MQFIKENPYIIVAIYVAIMSFITAILYCVDKASAQKRGRRIAEKTLLLFSILGGAVGGMVAMQVARHKTKSEHWYFTAINLLGIAIWIVAIVLAFIYL